MADKSRSEKDRPKSPAKNCKTARKEGHSKRPQGYRKMTLSDLTEAIDAERQEIAGLYGQLSKELDDFEDATIELNGLLKDPADTREREWLIEQQQANTRLLTMTNKNVEEVKEAGIAQNSLATQHERLEHYLQLQRNLKAQLELHMSFLRNATSEMRAKARRRRSA